MATTPTISSQQLSNQLNQLAASGATEAQISAAITKAGYSETDFAVGMNGKFEPLVVGSGTQTTNYTAAELAASEKFYGSTTSEFMENSTTSAGTVKTTTSTVETVTGGGSTTVFSAPPSSTTLSDSFGQQAASASNLQQAYALNPDSKFGKSALDKRLADGRLTQEQYNDIINSTPEQRQAKSSEYYTQYETARNNEEAAKTPGSVSVATTAPTNTGSTTVAYTDIKTENNTTSLNGDVPGTNITTETVDGTAYQVVQTADGKTYTSSTDTSTTVQVGPSVSAYDYTVPDDGNFTNSQTDENIQNTDAVLSEEEANQYINQVGNENIQNTDAVLSEEEANQYINQVGADNVIPQPSDEELTSNIMGSGVSSNLDKLRSYASESDSDNAQRKRDWRVRLELARGADYLYNAPNVQGILAPLKETKGIIFPYTPQIAINYAAHYDPFDVAHSNYKIFQYKNSSVDQITITCDFTAQDTYEANYLLAVIHFFRSVTKMFYGKDGNPKAGTPPPLCYLSGFGKFQFDRHPIAITSFNYQLPIDVDYIRAGSTDSLVGIEKSLPSLPSLSCAAPKGGEHQPPKWQTSPSGSVEPTYVPTKIQLQINAIPIVTRNDISNKFSVKDYATGKLLSGGIW